MKDNVSYQKTDFGTEAPDLTAFVLKTLKIAGIALKSDITVAQLQEALAVPSKTSQLVNDAEFINKTTLNSETGALQQADVQLQGNIDGLSGDVSDIQNALKQEISDRRGHDDILLGYIELLLTKAHTHDNKDVIDGITADRIALWDKISELDAQLEFADYKKYINNILFGIVNQFRDIYTAVNIQHYHGGLFGMVYDGKHLDGGSFTDTEIRNTVNGGSFGNRNAFEEINSQINLINQTLGTLSDELDAVNGEEV